MKTPPFLLGATLLFWGWQTGFLVPGLMMGIVLESAQWFKARWDVSNEDFSRIWIFCTLLLLAATVYSFTANEGVANFQGFFQNPSLRTERGVGTTTARTMASLLRWLPMVFFLFMGAQVYSSREGVPLETISLIMRRRWQRARQLGRPLPAERLVNVSYAYFGLCLVAAAAHTGEDNSFFWGVCVLLGWALWPHRSRNLAIWAVALGLAIGLGYLGQSGLGRLRSYLETFNPQWLSNWSRRGFDPKQSKTAIGQIGRIKLSSRIVIRLEPRGKSYPPNLLREATYKTYKAQTWYAGTSGDEFLDVISETNDTTYVLSRGKTNAAAVNIACYLQGRRGLLPLPEGCGRLEHLFLIKLSKNSSGALLAEGPGLVIFDALYGPGETLDGAPDEKDDLYVMPRETNALSQVLAELNLSTTNVDIARKTLGGFFQSKFSYSTWQENNALSSTNETPLGRFLTQTRKGHCEYFATATVLLLRQLGIPARYAVGYAVHESSGRKYTVRQRDAHAWCLVWNKPKQAWEDFDTTPASWVEEERKRASPLQSLSDLWSRIVFEFSKLRWGQTNLRQYILWALVPILAILLFQIIFRSRKKRRTDKAGAGEREIIWPGLDSEFYQLEKKLAERGLTREGSETFSAWLSRATGEPVLTEVRRPLQELLWLHYRYRFDPEGLNAKEREALRGQAKECLAKIAQQ